MASAADMEFLRKLGIDKLADVLDNFRALSRKRVLVGIPDANATRNDGPISNAVIGYIHEMGDASRNLPSRAFLVPGVRNVHDQTIKSMRAAALYALAGNHVAVDSTLHKMGLRAQVAVRAKITAGPFAPLAPSTIAQRRGPGPYRPLIDTGALRQSITYVIRTRK
jgi:hypothetical protein